MQQHNNKKGIARLVLLSAALIWGSSFILVKNTVESIPTHYLLFFRFSLGAAVLALVLRKRLVAMDTETLKKGAILGTLLFSFYSVQTLGVSAAVLGDHATTAGKSAFLTGFYCVLAPFVAWVLHKKKPDAFHVVAALLCIIGIGFVVLDGGSEGVLLGDWLTLLNALITSFYIVLASSYTQNRDELVITVIQFVVAALIAGCIALAFEPTPSALTTGTALSVLYLAVFCTAVALGFMNYGQKHLPTSSAALLLSLEAPFGVLFSILAGGEEESLSLRLGIGFVLIFVAVLVSETRLAFIPYFRRGEEGPF